MTETRKHVLLVTGGHPFELAPFLEIFDAMPGVSHEHAKQPGAQARFTMQAARGFDAYVLYDMPGIRFHADRAPDFDEPDPVYRRGFMELLAAGHGFVFLHHAIAGWPAWDEYADIIGGRFLYLPATLRGTKRQDSGYRHRVTHTVRVLRDHPVTAGVPEAFSMTDELYLYEVFEDSVEPLLASDHRFERDGFYSAAKVVREGKMFDNEGWEHAPGSNLIGWTRTHGKSRIVYLQCGDDPVAYANPAYRMLIRNAILWVSGSNSERAWPR